MVVRMAEFHSPYSIAGKAIASTAICAFISALKSRRCFVIAPPIGGHDFTP
jgi:hypothetical protein